VTGKLVGSFLEAADFAERIELELFPDWEPDGFFDSKLWCVVEREDRTVPSGGIGHETDVFSSPI
jgi:hypothetical protein